MQSCYLPFFVRVVFFPELSIQSFILFISVPVRCGHFACFIFLLQVVFSCCSTSILESVCLVYLLLDSHYVLLIPCPRSTVNKEVVFYAPLSTVSGVLELVFHFEPKIPSLLIRFFNSISAPVQEPNILILYIPSSVPNSKISSYHHYFPLRIPSWFSL